MAETSFFWSRRRSTPRKAVQTDSQIDKCPVRVPLKRTGLAGL